MSHFRRVVSQFDMLELDRFAKPLVTCPLLLHAASYAPDTVDLTHDHAAREYWLQCFTDAIDKVCKPWKVQKSVLGQSNGVFCGIVLAI